MLKEKFLKKVSNEIRRQKAGGPIGLSLTREIADCYIVNWDKQFMKKLCSAGISPAMLESLETCLKYIDCKLVMDDDKRIQDEEKSDEEIT